MIKSIYEECLLYVKLKPVKNTARFIYCILSSFSVFFDKKKNQLKFSPTGFQKAFSICYFAAKVTLKSFIILDFLRDTALRVKTPLLRALSSSF